MQQASCIFRIYKTGIKNTCCLSCFQLYLGALACRTGISFKNIFKDIFRQLLNCGILPQNILNKSNSIYIQHKQKTGFFKAFAALFSISKPLSPMES